MDKFIENLQNQKKEFLVVIENKDLGKYVQAEAVYNICLEIFQLNRKSLITKGVQESFYFFPSSIKLIEENEKELTFELQYKEKNLPLEKKIKGILTYFVQEKENTVVESLKLNDEKNETRAIELHNQLLDLDALEALIEYLFIPLYPDKKVKSIMRGHHTTNATLFANQVSKSLRGKKFKKAEKQWDRFASYGEEGVDYCQFIAKGLVCYFLEGVYKFPEIFESDADGGCGCDKNHGYDHCSCGCKG